VPDIKADIIIDDFLPKLGKPKPRLLTERVDHALEQILQGEHVEGILSHLNGVEQQMFKDLVAQVRAGKQDLDKVDELWRIDYVRRPPSIIDFIDDEQWLGQTLRTQGDNPGLYPEWRKILEDDFDLDSRIHNVVLTGSLGTGKSFVMSIIFLYRLTMARLLRNPQNFFDLSLGSRIVYALLSISRQAVQQTIMGDVLNFMGRSPFFLEECAFDPDRKYTDNRIDLGNDIWLIAGSKGWHVIGQNVMGVCLDEGNYRLEANPDETAYKLYDEVRIRIRNRFQKMAGFLPAISVLASSARDETSFTETVIAEIMKENDPSTQVVYRKAVYKVKRHLLKFKDRWFMVAYGLKNLDPFILKGWYDEDAKPVGDEAHEAPPPGASVELVPEDYLENFIRNPHTALQGFSGISTGGSHRLFSSTINIEMAIEISEREGYKNPATMEFLPISMEDDKNIWDYLHHPTFATRRQSMPLPLRNPDELRYGHLDLATTTMAGVAICHRVGQLLVNDFRNGLPFSDYRLVVAYDFILTIVAGRRRPISLEKIQNFFFWLKDFCGFRFGLVTADQFQSTAPLQMMESRGFNTGQLSMDKTKAPYLAWRQGFEEGRIRMFRQVQLVREAEKLMDLTIKIDHPKVGSKDTTDAAAGAYFNAITAAGEGGQAVVHPSRSVPFMTQTDHEHPVDPPLMTLPADAANTPLEPITYDA
jgi:hypothetical protein